MKSKDPQKFTTRTRFFFWAALATITFLTYAAPTQAVNSKRTSTRNVLVELELEEVADISFYQVEIKKKITKNNNSTPESVDSSKDDKTKLRFKQSSSVFKLKLEAGNYEFRSRVIAPDEEKGPWSAWTELLVNPEDVTQITAASYNWSIKKNQSHASIQLKWSSAQGANSYVVWIENLDTNAQEAIKISNQNNYELHLPIGKYKVGVQAITKDGVRSKMSYAESDFFVAIAKLPQIEVQLATNRKFSWKPIEDAHVKIDILRRDFFGNIYKKFETQNVDLNSWDLPETYQPGEYRLSFQYVSENFESGSEQIIDVIKKPRQEDFSSAAASDHQ